MRLIFVFICICILGVVTVFILSLPPRSAPQEYTLQVFPGDTLHRVANKLHQANMIRSTPLFIFYGKVFGNDRSIQPGEYMFKKSTPSYIIALRVSGALAPITQKKITIPEGSTSAQIAAIVHKTFPHINEQEFYTYIKDSEGYLFPDTYTFFPFVTKETIKQELLDTFEKKTKIFDSDIAALGYKKHDIIVFASLIEKEAVGDVDRETIAGILWRRLSIDMLLQVDAATMFANPFDTYRYKGLPSKPITNPGLLAIRAVLHPKKTSYLYYLHDKDGGVHYAVSYEDHKKNIRRYLQ